MKCFVPSNDHCSLNAAGWASSNSLRFFSLNQVSVDLFNAIKLATSIASKGILMPGPTLASDKSDEMRRSLSAKLPVVKCFSAKSAAADKSFGFRCNHD